jgi:hypothetical protein
MDYRRRIVSAAIGVLVGAATLALMYYLAGTP